MSPQSQDFSGTEIPKSAGIKTVNPVMKVKPQPHTTQN